MELLPQNEDEDALIEEDISRIGRKIAQNLMMKTLVMKTVEHR